MEPLGRRVKRLEPFGNLLETFGDLVETLCNLAQIEVRSAEEFSVKSPVEI